jgi:hypothetical protein
MLDAVSFCHFAIDHFLIFFQLIYKNMYLHIGLFGGILSSVAGTGVDICCFAILTILFRISEKVYF